MVADTVSNIISYSHAHTILMPAWFTIIIPHYKAYVAT